MSDDPLKDIMKDIEPKGSGMSWEYIFSYAFPCDVCGNFIDNKQVSDGKAIHVYTADGHSQVIHKTCYKGERK